MIQKPDAGARRHHAVYIHFEAISNVQKAYRTEAEQKEEISDEIPIFTPEASDSLGMTDFKFLTPGPADIILQLVTESDSSPLLSRFDGRRILH